MNLFAYIVEDTRLNHEICADNVCPKVSCLFSVPATGKLCTNAHVCLHLTIVYIILHCIEVKLGQSVEASAGGKLFLYTVACILNVATYPKTFY